MVESVGRLDSQMTISIQKNKAEDFKLNDLNKSGRERILKEN